jgi:hypothetical protein
MSTALPNVTMSVETRVHARNTLAQPAKLALVNFRPQNHDLEKLPHSSRSGPERWKPNRHWTIKIDRPIPQKLRLALFGK